jgi:hypothetical protein
VVDEPLIIPGGAVDEHPIKGGSEFFDSSEELISLETGSDERPTDYWIIVTISTLATLVLGFIIIYNRRSAGD